MSRFKSVVDSHRLQTSLMTENKKEKIFNLKENELVGHRKGSPGPNPS